MRQEVKRVKNLSDYLKIVIQPILKNPIRLRVGRKLKIIGLLPREIVGLFLVCVVGRYIAPNEDWTLSSDPDGRDGIIICQSGPREGDGFATEQVYIPPHTSGDLTQRVLSAIARKSSKGKEYGKERHLIIYCDKHGEIDHQKIKKEIASNNIFYSYWLIGKKSPDKWIYFVASPKTISDPVMAYEVTINDDFRSWSVKFLGKI